MQIGAFLYFRISGNCLDFETITGVLKATHFDVHRKGEVHKNKYGEFVCPEDSWQASYDVPAGQSLEDAIIFFMQPYLSNKDFISFLKTKYNVSLYLSLYPDQYQASIVLPTTVLSLLHELNIELSITLAYLSDIYNYNIK